MNCSNDTRSYFIVLISPRPIRTYIGAHDLKFEEDWKHPVRGRYFIVVKGIGNLVPTSLVSLDLEPPSNFNYVLSQMCGIFLLFQME